MKKISFTFNKFPRFWRKVGIDPFIDWALIIIISFMVAVVCVAVGAYTYADSGIQLSSASASHASTGSDITSFDSQKLYRVVTAFDVRAAERVQFEKGYAGPSDPSLPQFNG